MTDKPLGRVALCSCHDTMRLDEGTLRAALEPDAELLFFRQLCRDEIGQCERLLADDAPLSICCTREAPLFEELAGRAGRQAPLRFINIRETAGWSKEGGKAGAKMAALVRAGLHDARPAMLKEVVSHGRCLIAGPGPQALELARMVRDDLAPEVLLTGREEDVLPPLEAAFPLRRGALEALSGRIGRYEAVMTGVRDALPWARHGLAFGEETARVEDTFDLVIEISGGPARFGAHGRDGYFHLRPDDAAELARAAMQAARLTGEFEKPIYASCDAGTCAHARNGVSGCNRCIDACPSSAIRGRGEAVFVDPFICEGCGDCAAVCPSGAMSHAMPRRDDLLETARALLATYAAAGGKTPVVLFHDREHGAELIAALARFGDGLPAHVLPMELHSVSSPGHDILLALTVFGAARVAILAPPERAGELASLRDQMALSGAFLSALGYGPRYAPLMLDTADPDALAEWLAGMEADAPAVAAPFAAMGGKRDISRMALARLHEHAPAPAETVSLPDGAPYGQVRVDREKCTLCLACVSTCPAGALVDNPERPQLRFVEAACLQCGLCRRTCPEGAISLAPRYNFSSAAQERVELASDEPMECPACGKAFGSKSAIERVIAKLEGLGNPMFATREQRDLLRYCEDCRVIALSRSQDDPFKAGEVPRPRVTEDYAGGDGS